MPRQIVKNGEADEVSIPACLTVVSLDVPVSVVELSVQSGAER